VFCKIRDGEIPSMRVYEDDRTLAFMDINPLNAGHCLVITKTHAPTIWESDAEDLKAAIAAGQKVALGLRQAVKPDGLNVLQVVDEGLGGCVLVPTVDRQASVGQQVARDVELNVGTRGLGLLFKQAVNSALSAPVLISGSFYRQIHTPSETAGRSLTVQFGMPEATAAGTNRALTINGAKIERFHWVSHRIQSDTATGAALPQALEWHTAIDRMRMDTFKYMLDKWTAYSTPNGPLLDNAFALWTNHVAAGPSHGFKNLPIIIAGSAGGYLKQGQYIDAGNVTNNKLMNTLITAAGGRKAGAPFDNFGGADLAGGLISAMLA
jgi:hypothetical protein